MPFTERLYKYNQAILKDYGGKKLKLTVFKSLRTSGLEYRPEKRGKGAANDVKTDENISRAKSKVFELAVCNPWTMFVTVTISPEKYDRNDLGAFHRAFTQFLRDTSKRVGTKIEYLFVPETHANGAWHEHGLLQGLPISELRPFTLKEKLPRYLRDKIRAGHTIYDWPAYRQRFGWIDIEPVQNQDKVSCYITKYIQKGLAVTVQEVNAHLYYASNGLQTARVIKKGSMSGNIEPAFENDYLKIQWFKPSEIEVAASLINDIVE